MEGCKSRDASSARSAQAVTTEASSKVKSFQCEYCRAKFRRVDHLKRHIKLHIGGPSYQCPCGETFSRNDVLARHLKKCEKGRKELETLSTCPTKQTRTKTACNRCARLKLRCDSQDPCSSCNSSSKLCEYTRKGYSDPYSRFKVRGSITGSESPGSIASTVAIAQPSPSAMASETTNTSDGPIERNLPVSSHNILDSDPNCINSGDIPNTTSPSKDLTHQLETPPGSTLESQVSDFPVASVFDFPFDMESIFPFSETMAYMDFDYSINPQSLLSGIDSSQLPTKIWSGAPQVADDTSDTPRLGGGFSHDRIDPVESKCRFMRDFLLNGEAMDAHTEVGTYITRENLVICSELYGRNFQPNVPILHRPTFDLTRTSPILLLAIMLVGACYNENLIPVNENNKLAMRLLKIIEQQPHEVDMEVPPLSTLHACIILRPLLVLSRNEKADRFASLFFARIISMAERCGLFGPTTSPDYSTMTPNMFDWASWIEQETRRRVACQIFTQDMALCVFRRISPHFTPVTFEVEMPCYETCWEAETASKCLERLQRLPGQPRIAAATQNLRLNPLANSVPFEASAFGLTTLVLGLHSLLLQAIQTETSAYTLESEPCDSMTRLHQAFINNSIPELANEIVSRINLPTFQHINSTFDRWRAIWDLRDRQGLKKESVTLSTNPFKYWWLAKLYIVLYAYKPLINKDSEFAISVAGPIYEQGKTQEIQLKILSWLSQFNRREGKKVSSPGYYLPRVVEPLDDN